MAVQIPSRAGPREFLHEVHVEVRKIAWPSRDDLLQNAWLCLGFLVLLGGILTFLDLALWDLKRYLAGPG